MWAVVKSLTPERLTRPLAAPIRPPGPSSPTPGRAPCKSARIPQLAIRRAPGCYNPLFRLK